MNKFILSMLLFVALSMRTVAAPWQWSVEVKDFVSPETGQHPRAFLWIPEKCRQVRAVIVGQHNMTEETLLEHPRFRKAMARLGMAEVWISPGIDQRWDVAAGTQRIFDRMMSDLAAASGYDELAFAPVVPVGHSAMATYPWNFAAWNPQRTLAVLSIHGDAPRTHLTGYGRANLDWGARTIEGIPSLMVMGEYEWWDDRLFSAFDYRRDYPDAPLSFLADAGHGHFDISEELIDYLVLFLEKTVKFRLPESSSPDVPVTLTPVHASGGWLADRWHRDSPPTAQAAPYRHYAGDALHAFWYFDREMARATERYYARERGKQEQYIGFEQEGQLVRFDVKSHVRMSPVFRPEADGVTFHLKAVYTDTLRTVRSVAHGRRAIHVSRINGPVEVLDDTTFRVRFYRMGLENPKRTGDICLMASVRQDRTYKSAVQQIDIRIPYRNKEGREQYIEFPALPDVQVGTRSLPLQATADSGLPVSYYIKEGPAEVDGNTLRFTRIPPRAKYPLKVTVVAWQYGRSAEPKVQTAEAVERSFYIIRKD